jgi:hypothetical protein
MSDTLLTSLNKMLNMIRAQPDCPSKVALLEQAVRVADVRQDVNLGFALRKDLIKAATFSGAKEKALVAFTWCLAQCDREPAKFPETNLLWEYKWIVGSSTHFPQITRSQIADMLADMERRYERAGLSKRAVYRLRCLTAQTMGCFEEARQARPLWKETQPGKGDDPPAVECSAEARYLLNTGEDEKALKAAEPILVHGLRSTKIPHITYSLVLLPLVRLGRLHEAQKYHLLGYPLVSGNVEHLCAHALHLIYVTVTLNLDRGVQLFEKYLPWAVDTFNPLRRFEFYQSAYFLLDVMRDTGHETIAARLPKTLPMFHEEHSYRITDLAAYFDEQCRELAGRFNTRNGNDYFTQRLDEPRQWKHFITPCPLPKTASEG